MIPGDPHLDGKYPAIDFETIAHEPFPQVSPEDPAALVRHRRRVRTARFIVCETIAVAIMVASALAGVSARFAADNLTPIFRVLPVSAAIVAAILPIIFFGDPKRRNRPRRRDTKKAGG
jgi:hypothetical protein